MAYLTLIRIPGNSDELLADDTMPRNIERLGPKHGLIANVRAATEDGILVVNLWESKEGSEAMANEPDIQEMRQRQRSDVPADQVRFEHFDVGDDYRIIG